MAENCHFSLTRGIALTTVYALTCYTVMPMYMACGSHRISRFAEPSNVSPGRSTSPTDAETSEPSGEQPKSTVKQTYEPVQSLQCETSTPYHVDPSEIPPQQLTKKTLLFQKSWYEKYPWLHYCTAKKAILCFYCSKVCLSSSLPWAGNAEPAFISTGFSNWKKAVQRFRDHEASHTHFMSLHHWNAQKAPITVQFSAAAKQQQKAAWKCLEVIVSSIRYLAHEGLALRGHDDDSGHLHELLKLRTADIPELNT